LLLVHRDDADVPLMLAASIWGPVPAAVASAPGEPPSRRAPRPAPPPPPPEPLPPEVPASLDLVVANLNRLAASARPSVTLAGYRNDLTHVEREIETLARRGEAPPDVIEGLRGVLRYDQAAEVAWDALETAREQSGRRRNMPMAESATAPYFEDSPPA